MTKRMCLPIGQARSSASILKNANQSGAGIFQTRIAAGSFDLQFYCLFYNKNIQMGNLALRTASRLKACAEMFETDTTSLYESQQEITYSREFCERCLEHIIDLGHNSFDSLKKMHKYLHPSLFYVRIQEQIESGHEEYQNDLIHNHEEQLIISSTYVVRMYCNFLQKVVPTNISYFHFMREKDFYIHLTAIRYCLKIGHLNNAYLRKIDVFHKLTREIKIKTFRLFSHWIYDMVKYKCSAIYIQSETLPHLITALCAFTCGLIEDEKGCILDEYDNSDRNRTYHHCLYSLTYLLCEANKNQDYNRLQFILGGLTRLIRGMQSQANSVEKMFGPSYWFVENVGFIEDSTLEKITFYTAADLLAKRNEPISNPLLESKHKRRKFAKRKQNKEKYSKFQDEEIGEEHEPSNQQESPGATTKSINEQPSAINTLTTIELYYCLATIAQYFPEYANYEAFQQNLIKETKLISPSSFIRPFLIRIIMIMMSHSGYYESSTMSESWDFTEKSDLRINIIPELMTYYRSNQIDYSVEGYMVPSKTVGKNCSIVLEALYPRVIAQYERQVFRTDGEIWGQILKYNKHQFQKISS